MPHGLMRNLKVELTGTEYRGAYQGLRWEVDGADVGFC